MKVIRWAAADPPTLPLAGAAATWSHRSHTICSGFHAGHRRTWACAPASRVKPCQVIFRCETYRGHWSWRRIPGGGAFPLWVDKRLVEEDCTQYCKKWRFPWKAGTHDLETELGKKYRLTSVSLMSWKYRFKIPFHILDVWEQITTFFFFWFHANTN